jgi:NAD(P)H dehydrogenase (quinone)
MIIILYDSECNTTRILAQKIRIGIEQDGQVCELMQINNINEQNLNSAECIIFGCQSGFLPGVSYKMAKYMNKTRGIFENQIWKNKLAAGFTPDAGTNSVNIIQEFCNFAAKHSMIWISQGRLENEARTIPQNRRINSNKSFLGCIATIEQADYTAEFFGRRISQQYSRLLNIQPN